jgi:cytosine/adenosine deaminase-related metal-dependent hydrolase
VTVASANPRVLHGDAVLVGDGTSIRDGAIVVDGEGRILDLGPAVDVRARATGATVERLAGVLLPGLVDPHVHLELSSLRGKTKGGAGFVPWLESLQRARAEEDESERDAAIDRAIAELVEHGVVAVGEVTNTLVAWPRIARRLLGTIFHEIFSVDRDRGLSMLDAAMRERDAHAPPIDLAHRTRWTLVPHALHSTHPDVVRAIFEREGVERGGIEDAGQGPMTIHLAEHSAERAFLATGRGPWRDFLVSRGLVTAAEHFPLDDGGPIARALALGVARRDAALVHLTDARPDELAQLAAVDAIAVLCPRSNLGIETRLPPWNAIRAAGLRIAIGTDSLASAPSLDPFADARAILERHPDASPSLLVSAMTSVAATAIGWGDTLGLVARGRRPGVLSVACPVSNDLDPSACLLRASRAPRRLVVAAAAANAGRSAS